MFKCGKVFILNMETKRLIIDELRKEDKEDYFINISHDKKVLETFICTYQESLEKFDFDSYLNRKGILAIRLKETGKLIGILTEFLTDGKSVEIGYGIGSNYWNNGYVTEAVKAFIKYLFEEKGFNTVYASFFVGNDASKRVMEKNGMTYNRYSAKELEYLGKERDLIYYVIHK